MYIYVVKPGDSIYSIAGRYGVPPAKIISDNELSNPERLVVGQTLVILEGTRRHVVMPGETLYTIAGTYGKSVNELIAANPQIDNPAFLHPGQVVIIPPIQTILGTIEVNGYAMPSTDMTVLAKTLPNLTYLSVFSYTVNSDGTLNTITDLPLIEAARNAGVAPLMVINNKGFSSDVASAVLNNDNTINALFNAILNILRTKNYYGLNIDFEYVYPFERTRYNDFLRKAVEFFEPKGYPVSTALAPKISATQSGVQYEAHDYPVHGQLAQFVILMTYEWGFTFGPPMPVAPLDQIAKVMDYAVTEIPRNKIMMGIPNYGYDWTLPYVKGTAARVVSNVGAVSLAGRNNVAISFDRTAQAPFFRYYLNGSEHMVWFEDARSIRSKLLLANRYGLRGVSYWTIGSYFPQNWLVLNSMFNIRKVL